MVARPASSANSSFTTSRAILCAIDFAAVLADPDSPFWLAGGLVGIHALYLDLDKGIEVMKGDGALAGVTTTPTL